MTRTIEGVHLKAGDYARAVQAQMEADGWVNGSWQGIVEELIGLGHERKIPVAECADLVARLTGPIPTRSNKWEEVPHDEK